MYLESFLTEAMNQLTAKLVYNNEKAPNTDSKFFINSSKLTRKWSRVRPLSGSKGSRGPWYCCVNTPLFFGNSCPLKNSGGKPRVPGARPQLNWAVRASVRLAARRAHRAAKLRFPMRAGCWSESRTLFSPLFVRAETDLRYGFYTAAFLNIIMMI